MMNCKNIRSKFNRMLVIMFVLCFLIYTTPSYAAELDDSADNENLVSICDFCAEGDRLSNGWYWDHNTLKVYFQNYTSYEKSAVQDALTLWSYVTYPDNFYLVQFIFDCSSSNTIYNADLIFEWEYYTTDIAGHTVMYDIYGTSSDEPGYVVGPISQVRIKMNLNKTFSYGTTAETGKFDFRSAVAHELGHGLGVAHCHEREGHPENYACSTNCPNNVMTPVLPAKKIRMILQPYDRASLVNTYVFQHPFY